MRFQAKLEKDAEQTGLELFYSRLSTGPTWECLWEHNKRLEGTKISESKVDENWHKHLNFSTKSPQEDSQIVIMVAKSSRGILLDKFSTTEFFMDNDWDYEASRLAKQAREVTRRSTKVRKQKQVLGEHSQMSTPRRGDSKFETKLARKLIKFVEAIRRYTDRTGGRLVEEYGYSDRVTWRYCFMSCLLRPSVLPMSLTGLYY